MGRMGKDGKTYLNTNGDLMFMIKENLGETCEIFDAKGIKGNVHDSFKESASALHCFQAGHTHMNKWLSRHGLSLLARWLTSWPGAAFRVA